MVEPANRGTETRISVIWFPSASNSVVEKGATVQDSILWSGAVVMRGTHLERCVVGKDCHVKTNAAIFDGIVVNPMRPEAPDGK